MPESKTPFWSGKTQPAHQSQILQPAQALPRESEIKHRVREGINNIFGERGDRRVPRHTAVELLEQMIMGTIANVINAQQAEIGALQSQVTSLQSQLAAAQAAAPDAADQAALAAAEQSLGLDSSGNPIQQASTGSAVAAGTGATDATSTASSVSTDTGAASTVPTPGVPVTAPATTAAQ